MFQGVLAHRQNGREFPKSNPVCRARAIIWTIKKVFVELKRVRQRPAVPILPVVRYFEAKDGKIGPVRAADSVRGAWAVSKEERSPSLKDKSRGLQKFEMSMGLDMTVIFKEWEQQRWAIERG